MRVVKTEREVELLGVRGGVIVPTMGALHEGHMSLVRQARTLAGTGAGGGAVVVTIFVNPTQFGQAEDLARYPRTLDTDVAACASAGADVVFAPEVGEVYPAGQEVRTPRLPRVATEPGLEDAMRPGHFAGVCQVVLRLFEMVKPARAVFGEKDWQQLQVVRAMVAQEGLGIEIVPGETVREADGLAMSSRNRFLSGADRARGLALIGALRAGQASASPEKAERVMHEWLRREGIEPDYAVVRDAESLLPRGTRNEASGQRAMRAVIAARVGGEARSAGVRLLDNVVWSWPGSV